VHTKTFKQWFLVNY